MTKFCPFRSINFHSLFLEMVFALNKFDTQGNLNVLSCWEWDGLKQKHILETIPGNQINFSCTYQNLCM